MEKKINNPFLGRTDGYVDNGIDVSNPIQENWVHKEVLVRHGESEDDFVVDEKPYLIDSVNIYESIQSEAKKCDLKSMIATVLRNGDIEALNAMAGNGKDGYIDITGFPTDPIAARNFVNAANVGVDGLPDDIKSLGNDKLLTITQDELNALVSSIVEKQLGVVKSEGGSTNE